MFKRSLSIVVELRIEIVIRHEIEFTKSLQNFVDYLDLEAVVLDALDRPLDSEVLAHHFLVSLPFVLGQSFHHERRMFVQLILQFLLVLRGERQSLMHEWAEHAKLITLLARLLGKEAL